MHFAFLFWNIFLAVLPLYFSFKVRQHSGKRIVYGFALPWLLFFPNAAYLFTDIVHLGSREDMTYWLDVMILFLAGIYGIAIGLLSLSNVERWYSRLVSLPMRIMITGALFLLCGYGIYLGRVERWNSWDILAQPSGLFEAMARHSRHPFRNRDVWAISSLFGAGLYLLYLLLHRRQALIERQS